MVTIDSTAIYSFPYAFRVRYLGPTNYKPSRFKASIDWCGTKVSVTQSFSYDCGVTENELNTVIACYEKLEKELEQYRTTHYKEPNFNRVRRVEIPGSDDVIIILIRDDDI